MAKSRKEAVVQDTLKWMGDNRDQLVGREDLTESFCNLFGLDAMENSTALEKVIDGAAHILQTVHSVQVVDTCDRI